MKRNIILTCLSLGLAGMFVACTSERSIDEQLPKEANTIEKGRLTLNLTADAAFISQTRALNEANFRNTANYTVQLINSSNQAVLLNCKGSELSDNLPKELEIGSYEVKAFYGTEYPYSRDDFRVEGSKAFTIKAKEETTVTVDCLPTCGKISVDFDSDMAKYYSDYSVSYTGTAAMGSNSITWAKADTEPWYVKLNESGETITYTVNVTAKEDYAHVDANGNKQTTGTATGSFTLERNRAHKLSIKPNYTETTEGGLSITITIDESTNDKPITIEVPVSWV